ncbi:MAG: tetratricopeptide repeat protein [Bacteroidales bacterium]|nr:tetratricopeptide repeat protein [Bacteroidales bacterium]
MKFRHLIPAIAIALIFQACATQQASKQGQSAFKKGDYEAALQNFEQVIKNREDAGNSAEAEVYYKAGIAAWELGQTKKAIRYLEKAEYLEYPSPRLYTTLARAAKSIDNLSKELDALENYHEKYPEGEAIDSMRVRLFETYVESENWQKAVDLWPEVKDRAQSDADLLAGYLAVNKNLEHEKAANKIAEKILELEPENTKALEWLAKKYFWQAENMYVEEMTAYKNNRTTSQYNRLLNKLDQVYPTFEQARGYFLKLYKLDPKPKYADFLGKIYKRLQEEQKAEYYFNKTE